MKKFTVCPSCGENVEEWVNPKLTVDIIIEVDGAIVLIERKNEPFGWAMPGGFVDYGESLEDAAIREAKEETGLDVRLVRQFHSYSEPERDKRHHTVSVIFIGKGEGEIKAGDDAKKAALFTKENLPHLVFDHEKIVEDYFAGAY